MGNDTANPVRGEVSIKLGSKEVVLRPTYEALQAIEDGLGKGLLRLSREAASGELSTLEAAVIVTECVKAQGKAVGDQMLAGYDVDRVRELLMDAEGGVISAMGWISVLLALAVTGEYTPEGELKPAKQETTATA